MSVDRVSNCTSSPNPQWLTDATQPTAFSSCYISPTNISTLRYLSLQHRLHPRRLWARVFQTISFRASRTGPASVKVCKLAFRCFATRFAQQQWRNRRYRDSFESVKRKLASGKKKNHGDLFFGSYCYYANSLSPFLVIYGTRGRPPRIGLP